MRTTVFSIVFLALFAGHSAADILTISCVDPPGFNLLHGPTDIGEQAYSNDISYSKHFGSEPTFFLDSSRPAELLVYWGSHIPDGVSPDLIRALRLEAKAETAKVILQTQRQITAIEVRNVGVYVYSLYPELGYGVFTYQGHWATSGAAYTYTYYGSCRFR